MLTYNGYGAALKATERLDESERDRWNDMANKNATFSNIDPSIWFSTGSASSGGAVTQPNNGQSSSTAETNSSTNPLPEPTPSATSLSGQRDTINQKYGGDITAYDFNASYSGDASNRKQAYADYRADLNFVNYINALEQSKNDAIAQAKRNESQKLQYADTRRQLMQKYIPETLLAQGIANTGYTADALLKAENNYNQYAIGAMNDRANAEQDIMKQYQDSYNEYKKEYDEKAYERFLDEQSNKGSLYATGIELVNEGSYDKPQLEKWLEVNGLKKGDEIYDKVVAYYDSEKQRLEDAVKQESETEGQVYNNSLVTGVSYESQGKIYQADRLEKGKSDRVTLSSGDTNYVVKLDKVNDGVTIDAVKKIAGKGNSVVLYKDALYYVDNDGMVSKISQKGGNEGYNNLLSKAQTQAKTLQQ